MTLQQTKGYFFVEKNSCGSGAKHIYKLFPPDYDYLGYRNKFRGITTWDG